MAKKSNSRPAEPERPPELTVTRGEAAAKLGDRITKGRALSQNFSLQSEPDAEGWHEYNKLLLTQLFTNASVSEEYLYAGRSPVLFLSRGESPRERQNRLGQLVADRTNWILSLSGRLELYKEPPRSPSSSTGSASTGREVRQIPRTAFVVHGHDLGAREATARLLEQLEVKPIVLHEQANQGRTILEKFETHADAGFAVVLLTPDDVGAPEDAPGDELRPRARQNVILELGFFWGKLGRERVCVLYKPEVEVPSDLGGLVYVPFDDGGAWRYKLAEEIDAAGIAIDFNRLRRS
ncbi:TIR domain-containing protein [Anaeromyxobacter paludicola]|uniref:CD-NTase-associated protein 12/Pycsar effector protein TIR domain-containing protein n=1 Tax=Anaeromyxobacter paludicola TaxID=2918171 RepID=A0ABN6N5D3_9BACT|nr:nucleotide-binding protein [Anaeromyxobacter paludicola]BDG08379.1 hypothetical protein AMPC_14920 [Anaeromyxobacter paludicola]